MSAFSSPFFACDFSVLSALSLISSGVGFHLRPEWTSSRLQYHFVTVSIFPKQRLIEGFSSDIFYCLFAAASAAAAFSTSGSFLQFLIVQFLNLMKQLLRQKWHRSALLLQIRICFSEHSFVRRHLNLRLLLFDP